MSRMHFFESMERELDFRKEYTKLEGMCSERYATYGYSSRMSINSWIACNFRSWKRRANYTSYDELRSYLGFSLQSISVNAIDFNKYLLFCEMVLNLINDLRTHNLGPLEDVITHFRDTINATISRVGMEIRMVENEIIIVEKDAVAIEVADKVPELSDVIIEYNHYLLRGNLERKKELLIKIASALEPKKEDLMTIDSKITKDYFYLINNMDIRHNNVDPGYKNYCKKFGNLSKLEKEAWYDLIYEQGLALFVLMAQKERNKRINEFKRK